MLPVVAWMKTLEVPLLKEVSGSEAHQIPSPSPPPNHDLNYGQQLVQMFRVLRKHHRLTGYFQGIPKPRHEPDWSCKDGFELYHDVTPLSPALDHPQFIKPKSPAMHDVPEHLDKASDVIQPPQINPEKVHLTAHN